MLDDSSEADPSAAERSGRQCLRSIPRTSRAMPRSATRPLEVLELLTICRRPLSVSEIACALEIPQSSSSVLLQAMNAAGFVARDNHSRKFLPSARWVLLGHRAHDTFQGSSNLARALDEMSVVARTNVRLAIRNGVHVQYVHTSSPAQADIRTLAPGTRLPIARDALGRMLLLAESEKNVRGIVRHANAIGSAAEAVNVDTFLGELRATRAEGLAVRRDITGENEVVLAVELPARFGAPAAVGLGLSAARASAERESLATLLRHFATSVWVEESGRPHGSAIPSRTV